MRTKPIEYSEIADRVVGGNLADRDGAAALHSRGPAGLDRSRGTGSGSGRRLPRRAAFPRVGWALVRRSKTPRTTWWSRLAPWSRLFGRLEQTVTAGLRPARGHPVRAASLSAAEMHPPMRYQSQRRMVTLVSAQPRSQDRIMPEKTRRAGEVGIQVASRRFKPTVPSIRYGVELRYCPVRQRGRRLLLPMRAVPNLAPAS